MANGCQIYDTDSQAHRFYIGSVFSVAADWATPTGCATHVAPVPLGEVFEVSRETDPDCVLLDGTLAERDRNGDGRADYSAKHRRHGVNVQLVIDLVAGCCGSHPHCPAAFTT